VAAALLATRRRDPDIRCDSIDAWLEARISIGIGGSESAALFTDERGHSRSPFKSAYRLWQEKRRLVPSSSSETEWMYWGKRFEEPIARHFADVSRAQVVDPGAYSIFRHRTAPLFVTPDRFIVEGDVLIPLSVKNVSQWKADEWAGEECPFFYWVQLQQEMDVIEAPRGTIAALIGGNHFVRRDFERDDEFLSVLHDKTTSFWDGHVLTGVPPHVDASESTTDGLKRAHVRDDGRVIELPPEALEWTTAIREARAAAEAEELNRNRIRQAMGSAAVGRMSDGSEWRWSGEPRRLRHFKPKGKR